LKTEKQIENLSNAELIAFRRVVWRNMSKYDSLITKNIRLKARWDKQESKIWDELHKRKL
jgi:hypothetical protein